MTTLHTTVDYTRKILIGSGVLIGSIFLIIGLYRVGIFLKEVLAPTPPPQPNAVFGKIPEIDFPPNVTEENLTYTIDTVSGFLPAFPDRQNVYKIVHDDDPNLFDLDRTKTRVAKIGFRSAERKISDTVFEWTEADMQKRIVFDILSLDFIYTTNYFNYEPLLTSPLSLDAETGKRDATKFLNDLGLLPPDLQQDKTTTQLLTILGNELIPATSVLTTNIVRVDFFQKDMNELPIYYPKPKQSTINVLVSNYGLSPVVEANYTHQNISEEASDYPLKFTEEAFEELKSGKGYIASHFSSDTDIKIRDVFLAYYIGEKRQDYLMPIIVFTDKEGFYAYVSAIKDDWIQ